MSWLAWSGCMPYGRTLRTYALLLAAVATISSMFWQHDIFSDIILTKFVTFNITTEDHYVTPNMAGFKASGDKTRVTAFSLYTTKEEIGRLKYKWRCPSDNSTSALWGPDNMCRCLGNYAAPKTGVTHTDPDDTVQAVEQMCSRDVVPIYGKAFVGSIRGYWNFYIGMFMIHISILFSMMSVEYARAAHPENTDVAEADIGYPDQTPPKHAPPPRPKQVEPADTTHLQKYNPREIPPRNHALYTLAEHRHSSSGTASKLSLATAFDWTQDVDTGENVYMQVGVPRSDGQKTLLLKLWDFLVVVLSLLVIALVSVVLDGKNDFVNVEEKYRFGGSAIVMYIWALVVAIVTWSSIVMNLFGSSWGSYSQVVAYLHERNNPGAEPGAKAPAEKYAPAEHTSDTPGHHLRHYMKLCVLQDLNYVTGFMFVISTFSAQSGEHDDHTIFLDVACVLFIGFMQHLSHLTMLLKEQALGLCEDQLKKQALKKTPDYESDTIRSLKYEARMMDYIFQFFSTTRAFIFAIIAISVYVFSVRMGPTVFVQDAITSWNASARLFTLLFFVSPSVLYDLYYELVHFDHMRRYQRHLQYFGPQLWRIWGGIGFIIVLSVMTWQGYGGDEQMQYKMDEFLGGIKPSSNFAT